MTIETNGETQDTTTTETTTSQDTAQDSTTTSTDQSSEQQQTPEQIAAAEAAKTAETNTDDGGDQTQTTEEEKGSDPYGFTDSEDDKKLKAFVGEKTPAQVAKELMNAQALLGKKSVGIPGKDATPEEHRAFHKARGVPEDEKGYDFKGTVEELQKTAPEGWQLSESQEASFRKAAKLSNLSQGEANEFAKHYLADQFEARKELVANEVKAGKDASAILAKDWGPDRKPHEVNFDRGMRAIGLSGDSVDVFLAAFGGSGEARAGMVKAVAEIGRRQIEGGPIPGAGDGGQSTGMTKEQATAEIERIKADPELSKAFMNVDHARHKEISAEMARLGKVQKGIQ